MFGFKTFRTKPPSDERAEVLPDWPQPTSGGPLPRILADEHSLSLLYRTEKNQFAVIRLPGCLYLTFGLPNDEALGGHPLGKHGLQFYSVHEVRHSTLIQMLEQRNSLHHRHDRKRFLEGLKHYVFTFQDSTLDCVVWERDSSKPTITVFDDEAEADRMWRKSEGD